MSGCASMGTRAEVQHWDAAKDMFMDGVVSTWLEAAAVDNTTLASVRRIHGLDLVTDDHRHALALMAMNPMLPLILRGEIVSPAWLMKNPAEGYDLVTGPVCEQLRRMERELWLYQLRDRADRVRERARTLEIELDEETFQVVALATSRANLEAEWAARRRLFPDTDHAGLASLIERRRITDEDLVLLRSAALTQFEAIDPIIAKAEEVARKAGIDTFDHEAAHNHLATSRRDMYREIDRRVAGFARCGNPIIDEWADTFRVERRLPLPRALALLALPEATWTEPPRQKYVEQLLQFFEKRATNVAQRGPLVRLLIGKTTPRVDVTEIGSAQLAAESLLHRLIERTGLAASVSLEVLRANPTCEVRLRRLVSHASTYRRDTGIDGLYLGFPFLVFQDHRAGCLLACLALRPSFCGLSA